MPITILYHKGFLNEQQGNIFFSCSLNKTKQAVDDLSQGLRHRILNAKEREHDFRKIFKMETNQISDAVENGVSKVCFFQFSDYFMVGLA